MADYYPLIARAIAGLSSSTPGTRGAIYERARAALLGQLRGLDPPIPEADVARESASLEEAIARLEAELAPPSAGIEASFPDSTPIVADSAPAARAAPSPAAAAEPSPGAATEANAPSDEPATEVAPPPADEAAPAAAQPRVDAAPSDADAGAEIAKTPPAAAPTFFKVRRDKPAAFPAPKPDGFFARRAPNAAPSFRSPFLPPSGPAPVGDESAEPVPAVPDDPALREAASAAPAIWPPEPALPEAPPPHSAADTSAVGSEPTGAFGAIEPPGSPDAVEPAPGPEPGAIDELPAPGRRVTPAMARPRPDAQRPFAPQPPRDQRSHRRYWIVGFVVALLVFLVAIAAFQLRVRPEDVRPKAVAPASSSDAGSNGKIVDRIGVGSDPAQRGSGSSAADAAARAGAASKGPAADDGAVSTPRAALLVEAPDEPSKVRTYLGSVSWKVDNVSNGPGDPLSTAVRAEIEIPEEKLQAIMTLQKNFDGGLPASHTMKIEFVEPADSPFGPIQQINVPQMRRENTPTGDALSGVPVSITDNTFLVGLTRGAPETNNLDLLTSREWIDVPMLLSNGRIAKLTFEKGPAGNRAMTEALAAWKAQ